MFEELTEIGPREKWTALSPSKHELEWYWHCHFSQSSNMRGLEDAQMVEWGGPYVCHTKRQDDEQRHELSDDLPVVPKLAFKLAVA